MGIQLRPVAEADKDMLFNWRNDPYIIERSTSKRSVAYDEHERWLQGILTSSKVLPFIIECDGHSVGHIRFELRQPGAIITIYLTEGQTGHGLGVDAIRKGCSLARERWPDVSIIAHVRQDNDAGQRGFRKAGFELVDRPVLKDHVTMVLMLNEESETAKRYGQLFAAHGTSYKTLDWGSEHGQNLRFRVLADISELEGKRILDVGCGLGDFAGWLAQNNIQAEYTGLELTPALVEQACRNYPASRFVQGSIQDESVLHGEVFDYVFASGIFSTYCANGQKWLESAVSRMWGLCTAGAAFNSLSAWAGQRDVNEFYADPVEALTFCSTLTPWVALRCDYHPRDFTLYLYRSAQN